MNQFFCNNNCILLCRFQGDNINYLCRRLRNRFKKIEFIKDLSNNNWISPQTKYFWVKLFWKRNFLFIDNKTKYFCQINNKNGVVKTIIDDSTLIDIIKNEKNINISDKLDGLFDSTIITKINIINSISNKKLDVFYLILNIDRNITITLKEIFQIYDIKYINYDKISIEYTSTETFQDMLISDNLSEYLDKDVHNIL